MRQTISFGIVFGEVREPLRIELLGPGLERNVHDLFDRRSWGPPRNDSRDVGNDAWIPRSLFIAKVGMAVRQARRGDARA
jgi:hypothetical protein